MSWEKTALDNVVGLKRGYDLPTALRIPGDVPVISAGSQAGSHNVAKVRGPGFTIGRSSNIGQPQWSDIDFWPLNTTLYSEDFKGNNPKWLFYLFNNIDLSGFNSGTAQASLNRNYIKNVAVLRPSRNIQDAIVGVLGALDDKIATNQRVNIDSRKLVAALSMSAPSSCLLRDLATIHKSTIGVQSMAGKVVNHFSLPDYDEGAAGQVDGSSIRSGKNLLGDPVVLVSKLNPRIPRIWAVDKVPSGLSVASTEFVALKPTPSVTVAHLWAVLIQPLFTDRILGQVSGTTGSHQRIRPEAMMNIEIADPRSFSRDQKELLDSLVRLQNLRVEENQKLAQTRDELLPLLMDGRITVKDAERIVEEEV